MPRIVEGSYEAAGLKFAIVVSRFNEFISSRLLEGALDAIKRHGGSTDDVLVARVPGSWETPLVAKRLAAGSKFDAVICLGAVIRGGTVHWEYVASEAAKGVAQTALETGVPITFGILTTDTVEQAVERAGTKSGNKGADAAMAAIEMANLLKAL